MSVRVVTATFRVVTPLFLGGAEPSKRCELRTASIKGALLFWWRALQPKLKLAELRRLEGSMWGSSDDGQSKWLLDARPEALLPGQDKGLDPGRAYLAGQGLARLSRAETGQMGRPHRPFADGAHGPKPFESTRPYLRPGGRIHLRAFRRRESAGAETEAAAIRDACCALATFGGLGSRSRRGFGSLHLQQLTWNGTGSGGVETAEPPSDLDGWQSRIAALLDGVTHAGLPEYTKLSQGARVLMLEAASSSPEELHEALGAGFRDFRSHERSGGVGQADHDDVAGWLGGKPLAAPPRRAVFGLPHNYYFSSTRTKVGVDPAETANRRASPLFLHMDEIGDGDDRRALGVLTFLPAAYLPRGERVRMKGGGRSIRVSPRAGPELWRPIHDWLDELKTRPPHDATVREYP